jgi:hypothetical protein
VKLIGKVTHRPGCGTTIARFNGKTASCSAQPLWACERAVAKTLGDQKFLLKRIKAEDAYEVYAEE